MFILVQVTTVVPFQGYFVNCLSAMVAIGYVYSRAGLAALLLYCEYPVQGQLH